MSLDEPGACDVIILGSAEHRPHTMRSQQSLEGLWPRLRSISLGPLMGQFGIVYVRELGDEGRAEVPRRLFNDLVDSEPGRRCVRLNRSGACHQRPHPLEIPPREHTNLPRSDFYATPKFLTPINMKHGVS